MRKSIKYQFILLFLLIGLAPIAVIFAIHSPSMLRDLTIQNRYWLNISARSQVKLIALSIKEKVKEAELLAASGQIITLLKSEQKMANEQMQKSLEEKGISGLYLFDKNGDFKAAVAREAQETPTLLNKNPLKESLQGRSALFSLSVEKAPNPLVLICIPVFEGKEVLGALAVIPDLHSITSVLKNTSFPSISSFIVDKEGIVLASLDSGYDSIEHTKIIGHKLTNPQTGSLTDAIRACIEGKGGFSNFVYTNHAGQKVLAAWEWVSELGIGVIVETDVREIFGPLNEMRRRLWWLLLTVGLGVTVASFFAGRKLAEPIVSLASSVKEIARGNQKEMVDFQSQNEISDIAQHINQIIKSLRNKNNPP